MIARVTSGKSGIAEYLESGQKAGRSQSRDELDKRVVLDGNLDLTHSIISDIQNSNQKSDAYYHITLGFAEKNISDEKIKSIYEEYKELITSSYQDDEINFYAEIHQPKLKRVKHFKTGEMMDRLPHVHIVIPRKNLISNTQIHLFGRYEKSINHLEMIQEHINEKFNLKSAKESERNVIDFNKAEVLSRYKNDTFNKINSEIKEKIFNAILERNINNKNSFLEYLNQNFDDVKETKQYIKIKNKSEKKYIRLTEQCFSNEFINERVLRKDKPTKAQITSKINEWKNKQSKENKYLYVCSNGEKLNYLSFTEIEKKDFLQKKESHFYKKHGYDYQEIKLKDDNLYQIPLNKKPNKFIESQYINQLIREHADLSKLNDSQQKDIVIEAKKKLSGKFFLSELQDKFNLNLDEYRTHKVKGQLRINFENINYNATDFLTKHLHLSYDEAKPLLLEIYQKQRQMRDERTSFNSIVFTSNYTTSSFMKHTIEQKLDESIRIFNYLKKKEELNMSVKEHINENVQDLKDYINRDDENTIENANLSFRKINRSIREQEHDADKITLKFTDLVANKNTKKKRVEYKHQATGKVLFTDTTDRIVMKDRKPSKDATALAMELASERFGTVRLTGSRYFKRQCLQVAVEKNLNVIFDNKKLHQQFIDMKKGIVTKDEELNIDENSISRSENKEVKQEVSKEVKQEVNQEVQKKNRFYPVQGEVLEYGTAPYLFNDDNKESFFMKINDNDKEKTVWGRDLANIVIEKGINKGDQVEIEEPFKQEIEIKDEKEIKDEQGKVRIVTETKRVEKNIYSVNVLDTTEQKQENILQDNEINHKSKKELSFDNLFERLNSSQIDKIIKSDSRLSMFSGGRMPEDSFRNMLHEHLQDHPYKISQSNQYNLRFELKDNDKVDIFINGQKPEFFEEKLLNDIKSKNDFLKNKSMDQIKLGELSAENLKLAPMGDFFDKELNIIKPTENEQQYNVRFEKNDIGEYDLKLNDIDAKNYSNSALHKLKHAVSSLASKTIDELKGSMKLDNPENFTFNENLSEVRKLEDNQDFTQEKTQKLSL